MSRRGKVNSYWRLPTTLHLNRRTLCCRGEVTVNDVSNANGSDSASHTGNGGGQYGGTPSGVREVKGLAHEKKYVTDVGGGVSQTTEGRSDEQFILDVRNAFSGIPQVKKQWRNNYFKIMVVGESGLGMFPSVS